MVVTHTDYYTNSAHVQLGTAHIGTRYAVQTLEAQILNIGYTC